MTALRHQTGTENRAKICPETKAIADWIDWLVGCNTYDDGTLDEDFLKGCKKLLKSCSYDRAKTAKQLVIRALKEEGYHDFSESGVGFLDEFRNEGLKRVDWNYIGQFFSRLLKV